MQQFKVVNKQTSISSKGWRKNLWRDWQFLLFVVISLVFCQCRFSGIFVDGFLADDRPEEGGSAGRTESSSSSSFDDETSSSSYLLLCLTDGSIYSVSAWTGAYHAKIRTNPLLQTNREDFNSGAVIPGLDGRLYWTNEQTQQLHELPLTIHSLLDNPVRSCDPEHPEIDCGILTAEAETSLLALSPTGKLMWKTDTNSNNYNTPDEFLNDEKSTELQAPGTQPALLLQRKDYWVQHVLASTGRQSWNVSLGTYQALDFGPEDTSKFDGPDSIWEDDDDVGEEEEDDDYFNDDFDEYLFTDGSNIEEIQFFRKKRNEEKLRKQQQRRLKLKQQQEQLPAVHFSNAGHTLTAVHPVSGDVLWRQDVTSVVSSVFGIYNGQWKTLEVIQQTDEVYKGINNLGVDANSGEQRQLLLTDSENDVSGKVKFFPDDYYQQLLSHQYRQQQRHQHKNAILQLPSGVEKVKHKQQQQPTTSDLMCPAPPVFSNEALFEKSLPPRVQSQPEGLLLSWSFVAALVLAFAASVLGFYFWYKRKKEKWLHSAAASMDIVLRDQQGQSNDEKSSNGVSTDTATTLTSSGENQKRPRSQTIPFNPKGSMRRTLSLPGKWGDSDDNPESSSLLDDKHDHSLSDLTSRRRVSEVKAIPATSLTTPKTEMNDELAIVVDQDVVQPGPMERTVSTVGGFPLVQYSRYASEFQEMRPMGKGGFGTVFCCKNVLDGRDYAIKKVSITGALTSSDGEKKASSLIFQQQLHRVLREVKVLAVLDHPNIVRYYTAWLEIMKDGDDDDNDKRKVRWSEENKESSIPSSQCYSSSLLLTTDSVSQWETSGRGGSRGRPYRPIVASTHHHYNDWEGTGFTFDSSVSGDPKSSSKIMPKRRSLRMTSSMEDLLIFEEDSKEASSSHNDQDGVTSIVNPSLQERSGGSRSTTHRLDAMNDKAGGTNDLIVPDSRNNAHAGTILDGRLDSRKSSSSSFDDGGSIAMDGKMLPGDISSLPLSTTADVESTRRDNLDHSTLESIPTAVVRHTLYIQMELCSQKTIADFLQDPEYRGVGRPAGQASTSNNNTDTSKGSVDIPKALRLFLQIAEAVKHVHNQGLIHRDLKPSNCFLNEPAGGSTTVKVGDFGLSRHEQSSTSNDDNSKSNTQTVDSYSEKGEGGGNAAFEDHTAGVGTRLYASPEQMNGSDYDNSTDVYSLGIMLFELLYPMYTGMERNICLSRLRESLVFPTDWHGTIGVAFPDLEDMIRRMIRREPAARPSAESVARHVSSILGEFTVLALDQNHDADPEIFLLRVEAEHREDTLGHTIRLIHEISASLLLEDCSSANDVTIVQYGLRSSSSAHGSKPAAIMEFALKYNDADGADSDDCCTMGHRNMILISRLVSNLKEQPGIYKARQVSSS